MIKELSKTNGEDTVVGENVRVTGKLHTTGNIQINGAVKGELSSDGIIIIGKTATIEGPITASDVKVEGSVNGNITVKNELELDSEARVYGDINVKTLSVKAGAIFIGKSVMGEEKRSTPAEKTEVKEEKQEEAKEPEMEIE